MGKELESWVVWWGGSSSHLSSLGGTCVQPSAFLVRYFGIDRTKMGLIGDSIISWGGVDLAHDIPCCV